MPGVCLNMIVKDEAKILERCLASVAPWIDHYVIADTGSRDRTPDLIRDFFADRGVPGEVVSFPFQNFEQARNEALAACRSSAGEFDYVLFTDADMELVVDDDDFKDKLQAPAHLVRQVADLAYDNVRFVHRRLPARYIGVTHEYLDTCGTQPTKLDGVWFRDHAEGASRSVKTKRDAKLLKEGLAKEPQNVRYMFYLAQTLKDARRFKEAIRWYEKRIAAGGWAEEVWYSAYMIAFCYKQLAADARNKKRDNAARDADARFLKRALDAYQMRPTRAEPLHLLAEHYRQTGANALATLMCETGGGIPMPDDRLFLEPYVYEYGFLNEFAIAGFYSPLPETRKQAYEICMELALDPHAPWRVRGGAQQNTQHYAMVASVAFGPSLRLHRIELEPPMPGLVSMNPSVSFDERGALLANVRWVNYHFEKAGYVTSSGIIATTNETVRLNLEPDRLTVEARSIWIDEAAEGRVAGSRVQGYEDCRLFRWLGRWWAMATVRDRRADGLAEIALLEVDMPDDLRGHTTVRACHVQPDIAEEPRHEKNWTPLVRNDELLFVYEADPTLILQVDPASLRAKPISSSRPELALSSLRGSSHAVHFPVAAPDGASVNGYLYVAHEAFEADGSRRYTHRLVWLDEAMVIRHVSDPFYFTRPGIEFCAGLEIRGNDVIMSFGVRDVEAWIAVASREDVTRWLLAPSKRGLPR